MEWYEAVILGVVEGITEYLPISSTGHLILTAALLGLGETEDQERAINAFNIVIQGGAILAVLGLYRGRVAQMVAGLLGRNPAGRRLLGNLFIAFLPAAVLGVLLHDTIERLLFRPWPVIGALALGGVVLIVLTPWQQRTFREDAEEEAPGASGDGGGEGGGSGARRFIDIESLTWKQALVIGVLQCVAMWPGTSRSMMTIVGGMLMGLRPRQAAEFSFLLGLPTLGGACVYATARSLLGDEPSFTEVLDPTSVVIGLVTATISAALAIKWLVGYLSSHGVAVFGWYRITLSSFFLLFYALGFELIKT